MTTRPHDDNDHHEHAHLDGGRCLDGTGRTWKPGTPPPIVSVDRPLTSREADDLRARWRAGLGPGHDTARCAVCRGQRRALVDVALVLALACLLVLLLAAWWLPPAV